MLDLCILQSDTRPVFQNWLMITIQVLSGSDFELPTYLATAEGVALQFDPEVAQCRHTNVSKIIPKNSLKELSGGLRKLEISYYLTQVGHLKYPLVTSVCLKITSVSHWYVKLTFKNISVII